MNARTQEKLYGGFTISELRAQLKRGSPDDTGVKIMTDLLDALESPHVPEVIQRLRRIETKVHKLALHTGAEPEGETTMTLSANELHVPGYDVTLAEIRRAVEGKLPAGMTIYLLAADDTLLGTLRLTGKE